MGGLTVYGCAAALVGSDLLVMGAIWEDTWEVDSDLSHGFRFSLDTGQWSRLSSEGAPVRRFNPGAAAMADRVAFWGGSTIGYLADGGIYDPASDAWELIPDAGEGVGREYPDLAWTGAELLVWGGRRQYSADPVEQWVADGLVYDYASGSWRPMNPDGAPPVGGVFSSVAWTGAELIVWGGSSSTSVGARYDPRSDTWSSMSNRGSPSPRVSAASAWTGRELVVFGGSNERGDLTDGGAYDPTTDTWRPISTRGAPGPRAYKGLAAWTGSEVAVWSNAEGCPHGAFYDPVTDMWRPISRDGAPPVEGWYLMLWTGQELLFFGQRSHYDDIANGALYRPLDGPY